MIVIHHTNDLRAILATHRATKKTIGFVPTMGALHDGHLSLIHMAKRQNDLVVCSIFVNPTQFNDKDDLNKYPRPIDNDIQLLEDIRCDILFNPSVNEVYPTSLENIQIDLQGLDHVMEGASRPGHFHGVVQVVHRLLDLVQPTHLYMGQKDFQQFCIIRHMIQSLNLSVHLHMCPIIREQDGLAMSSRNIRLSPTGRRQSSFLFKSLTLLKEQVKTNSLSVSINKAKDLLKKQNLDVEYLEVVDAHSLEPVKDFDHPNPIVACLVVRIDGVRLLDNMIIKE